MPFSVFSTLIPVIGFGWFDVMNGSDLVTEDREQKSEDGRPFALRILSFWPMRLQLSVLVVGFGQVLI